MVIRMARIERVVLLSPWMSGLVARRHRLPTRQIRAGIRRRRRECLEFAISNVSDTALDADGLTTRPRIPSLTVGDAIRRALRQARPRSQAENEGAFAHAGLDLQALLA